jgi:hypothetical protein
MPASRSSPLTGSGASSSTGGHYRDVFGEKWDEVLRQSVSKIGLAKLADYWRELMALIARAHDTHANLWSSLAARPPVGDCRLAVTVRFIEK